MKKTEHLEIERKFLVEYPDTDILDVRRSASILQTYLSNGEGDSQRRVRRIIENGFITYKYTEKHFCSASVRVENERTISADEYAELLKQSKGVPVDKTRYAFDYMGQMFELDCYSFSDRFAILELELLREKQRILFPDNINVLREVTSDHAYSNAALADAGAFPDERKVEC
ncbi:CYTH domain-containing protein [Ruminococcus sp. YRD2003]|uniref:hypothetical protein n=1 Tax=Ruminococcus sp. YRD2003 TaxID=1452313 RepID=UPI0008AD74F1|nr:CYTH domain-containing protein [Ruminococcus flavefaciens]